MQKVLKYLAYSSMVAVILAMMAATVLEKLQGTPQAMRLVYHNPVFMLLWAVAAVSGLLYIVRRGAVRNFFTFGLHLSFVLILCGALVTHLSGESGMIHLREGEPCQVFETEEETSVQLPFSLRLEKFEISYHPGTRMPSGYSSAVTLLPEGRRALISMNNILRYKGYRFYQADYDEDLQGSILAVSHDPWGVAVTYIGYALLLLSMLGFFFQKNTAFRAALRRLSTVTAALLVFTVLPSAAQGKAEQLYLDIARPHIPFMLCLTLGVILFIVQVVCLSKQRKSPRWLHLSAAAVALLVWLYLSLVIGLRWSVSGTGPYVGRYSVMMLMAWFAMLAVILFSRKLPLIQPLGFLVAGFTMLMASRSSVSVEIMPLMPVLQTPLLSIHVVSMMLSYTLFGLVAFNGIMGVSVRSREVSERLKDVSLVFLYPAVFILTFGTFLGAVWANISWGSYWAWDPKETWALVTLLVYGFTLHGDSLKCFRNPRFFHWFTIFAFLSVLVTYFGVNLLLGGMHSYA